MIEPLKILIVDDSLIFRGIVEKSLQDEDDVQIIGSVRNGVKALEAIRAYRPDLVTLDVEMPEMNGLETLQAIQEINAEDPSKPPIGVIMLSSHTYKGAQTTIEALEMGAFDFATKPSGSDSNENIETLRRTLLTKIRYFASRKLASRPARFSPSSCYTSPGEPSRSVSSHGIAPSAPADSSASRSASTKNRIATPIQAIFIGVSTGGPRALIDMLPSLCEVTDLPIFIVQHMPPTFTKSLAESLDIKCLSTVVEAQDQELVENGHVYIAPGGYHMLVHRKGSHFMTVLNQQAPENGCRPSVDVLFRSAASVYSGNVLAMILTGMGNDGCKSLGALKRSGAYVIAQDEKTSVVWGMPGSAVASGNVDCVCPLMEIPKAVEAVVCQPVF